ncbi:MAG: BON domain-containing protein [Planctomycetota bacterium]|jgi:osmotically-inducible protein OsmY
MLVYRKWVLSLGIAAVTPGITLAGPFSFFKSDQKTQETQAVNNQKLAEQAAGNLRAAKLRGFDMEIEVQKGVCTLKGKIASPQQKQQAEAACLAVAGINKVDNKLVVLEAAQQKPAATQTTAAPRLPEQPVQQAVAQGPQAGQIEQTGFFGKKRQPQQAGPNGQQVANAVAMAVQQSGLRGHDLNLKVQNGTAILSGKAASPQDVAALTQIVSRVPGVRQVQNNVSAPGLQAPAPPKTQNQQVAEQIANALAANRLSGLDIEVRYNNGTATLSGAVPHPQVKAIAHQVTASVPGVQQVNNKLIAPAAPQAGPRGPQGPPVQQVAFQQQGAPGAPPMMAPPQMAAGGAASHMAYDMPHLPAYAWPSYASYPNAAQISYPQQYSASAWPYIGPFYPYPQVPLGWRQVQLEWDDGNWNLNFNPRTEKWFWFLNSDNWE